MAAAGARSFFWETFPPMPTCRVYCSPAYQDGHLFVVGGCSQVGQPLDTVEMLDVVSCKWLALPPLPTPRAGAAVVALGKQVLVIGGMDSGQRPLAVVEAYNAEEGKWEQKAALTQPAMGVSAIERGIGALSPPAPTSRWPRTPPCPSGAWITQGSPFPVCLAGNQSSPLGSAEGFSPSRKKWETLPPMPTGRCSSSSLQAPSLLFVIGGVAVQGPSSAVEALCLREGL
uniref:Kelch domain-containing protein 8B n=1 Tax=Sphenodon punctatus TaxID=8508 RepID=A0A8D0GNV8_SPHPU